jgi:hypothetical protein
MKCVRTRVCQARTAPYIWLVLNIREGKTVLVDIQVFIVAFWLQIQQNQLIVQSSRILLKADLKSPYFCKAKI